MANKQIIEFDEKTAPDPGDHLLLQENGSGVYLQASRASLVRRRESLQMIIGDGSSVPAPGPVWMVYLPEGCQLTVTGWRLGSLDGSSGSMQVDLWHDQNRASAGTADSICGSGGKPCLSGQSENSSTDLSGWSTTLLEGGCLVASLESISGLTRAVLALDVEIVPTE